VNSVINIKAEPVSLLTISHKVWYVPANVENRQVPVVFSLNHGRNLEYINRVCNVYTCLGRSIKVVHENGGVVVFSSRYGLFSAVFVAVVFACVLNISAANLALPHIFGDNMVLQRGQNVPVWGQVDAGQTVTVEFAGQTKTAVAGDDGKWKVVLSPLKASSQPQIMRVSEQGADAKLQIKNILVGDVWLCSGQSNMEFPVKRSLHSQKDIAAANYPLIRHITIPRTTAALPRSDVQASWKVCSPATVGDFSAVAYYFARNLYETLDIPIGLVHSSWGGTRIESWTPPVGFDAVPELKKISDILRPSIPSSPGYKKQLAAYIQELKGWTAKAEASLDNGRCVEPPPATKNLFRKAGWQDPTILFNGMINPLIPFALRGAIWYQGEANLHANDKLYTEKMEALVYGWRKLWGQGDFPFYYVQIAPFVRRKEPPRREAEFWEMQADALTITNTAMVVINDIGNIKNIHPVNKQEVGRRLSLVARAKLYGESNLVCSGPTYLSMNTDGAQIKLKFSNTGGGLKSRDGKPLDWFEIAGADGEFHNAQAEIVGDTVVVSSDDVPSPKSVRFAWRNCAEPNLMNAEGLPAVPFRTGR
jgi:sialate O-acetylesterase